MLGQVDIVVKVSRGHNIQLRRDLDLLNHLGPHKLVARNELLYIYTIRF